MLDVFFKITERDAQRMKNGFAAKVHGDGTVHYVLPESMYFNLLEMAHEQSMLMAEKGYNIHGMKKVR
jgi:hypothetical protein